MDNLRLALRTPSGMSAHGIELRDLLPSLAAHGAGLSWYIWNWDCCVLEPDEGEKSLAMMEHFRTSGSAVPVTWSELEDLAKEPAQMIDAIIVGLDLSKRPVPWSEGQEPNYGTVLTDYRYIADMYLEADDNTTWEVESAWFDDIDALRVALAQLGLPTLPSAP